MCLVQGLASTVYLLASASAIEMCVPLTVEPFLASRSFPAYIVCSSFQVTRGLLHLFANNASSETIHANGWRPLQKHPDTSIWQERNVTHTALLPVEPSRKTLNVHCEIPFLLSRCKRRAQSPVHSMQLKRVETKHATRACTCSCDAAHCIGLAEHMIHCTVLAKP